MTDGHSHANAHATNTRGGAGLEPTPATNTSGNGPGGLLKGGIGREGPGHTPDKMKTSYSSADEFASLRDEKNTARGHFMDRANHEAGVTNGTCATEDHSFMNTKPGGSDTLPGWKGAKDFVHNM
ncbi:hypothetical protein BDV25DRAFT_138911 [Aspergillus avenaceus]|uniref:Uncharacterized protein n=1 Tax=Aspergillus avenaceus TaxID=36643 RepID=A0A5N6TYD0_ASPAV|nr:hypothetical protein BDV25DRAFT_138911 [Aspergillus avenaceus]